MDIRVVEFRDRLFSYADKELIPIVDLRDEILLSHEIITDEVSRIELMRLFNVVADIAAAHLEDMDGDLRAFNAHRIAQIHLFLRAESLVNGRLNIKRLRYVTDREIKAGRMTEDNEIRRFALGDKKAFRH